MSAAAPASGEIVRSGAAGSACLDQFCATDSWHGELETGLFRLNGTARQIFALAAAEGYGLLSLIQCFDPADHSRLIGLFERAASEPSEFSFSSTVARGGRSGQPVFCIGRSQASTGDGTSSLSGIFIFPHL